MDNELEKLPKEHTDAMNAIFELCEAVSDGNMSIGDLKNVLRLSVSDGYETMIIILSMVQQAIIELE